MTFQSIDIPSSNILLFKYRHLADFYSGYGGIDITTLRYFLHDTVLYFKIATKGVGTGVGCRSTESVPPPVVGCYPVLWNFGCIGLRLSTYSLYGHD